LPDVPLSTSSRALPVINMIYTEKYQKQPNPDGEGA